MGIVDVRRYTLHFLLAVVSMLISVHFLNVDIRIDIAYNIYTIVIRGECDERERAFEKTC